MRARPSHRPAVVSGRATEAGRTARAEGVAIQLDAERQVFGALSAEDGMKLGELLERLGQARG